MAISVVKRTLSGQADHGLWITLTASTDTGTVLHTCAPSSTAAHDTVYVYANNSTVNSFDIEMSVGSTAAGNRLVFNMPARTFNYPLIEGLDMWGIAAASGTALKAGFGTASAGPTLYGYYTRYTES